ncbi:MAG: N-acetylmuramoyl-L-alanine amidase [Fusobacteriaceae bacterium]
MKKFFLFIITIFFISCSNNQNIEREIEVEIEVEIDSTTYSAKGQNSRIRYIILHYTAINDVKSLRVLTENNVSSHYLVTLESKDPIFSLVHDNERAWHAGISSFGGRTNLNDTSLGIEIVNLGYNTNIKYGPTYGDPNNLRPREHYYPYTVGQIEKVAFLLTQLKKKYDILDKNILGHSDIAPDRKQDPGPFFPWKLLHAEYNLGAWYDTADKEFYFNEELFYSETPLSIKNEFSKYGYKVNDTDEWDYTSQKLVYAFQAHFRPEKIDGIMDLETYAILKALNKKYS